MTNKDNLIDNPIVDYLGEFALYVWNKKNGNKNFGHVELEVFQEAVLETIIKITDNGKNKLGLNRELVERFVHSLGTKIMEMNAEMDGIFSEEKVADLMDAFHLSIDDFYVAERRESKDGGVVQIDRRRIFRPTN